MAKGQKGSQGARVEQGWEVRPKCAGHEVSRHREDGRWLSQVHDVTRGPCLCTKSQEASVCLRTYVLETERGSPDGWAGKKAGGVPGRAPQGRVEAPVHASGLDRKMRG